MADKYSILSVWGAGFVFALVLCCLFPVYWVGVRLIYQKMLIAISKIKEMLIKCYSAKTNDKSSSDETKALTKPEPESETIQQPEDTTTPKTIDTLETDKETDDTTTPKTVEKLETERLAVGGSDNKQKGVKDDDNAMDILVEKHRAEGATSNVSLQRDQLEGQLPGQPLPEVPLSQTDWDARYRPFSYLTRQPSTNL